MAEPLEITVAIHEDRITRLETEQIRMRDKQHEHGNKLSTLEKVEDNYDRLDRHVRESNREVSVALGEIRASLTDIKTKLATNDGKEQGETTRRTAIMSAVGLAFSVLVALVALYVFLENHLVNPP